MENPNGEAENAEKENAEESAAEDAAEEISAEESAAEETTAEETTAEETEAEPVIAAGERTFTGSDYTIYVSYGEEAGLPENVELVAQEIFRTVADGSEEYTNYLN